METGHEAGVMKDEGLGAGLLRVLFCANELGNLTV